jgi:hypothetical protein
MIPVTSAFQSGVYGNVRQFDAQLYFTCAQLNGGARTLYDDSRIINFDLVEEISTLNDTVPSDLLTIELDNSDGAFNFLNMTNMHTIIAGRPKLELQVGLNEVNTQGDTWTENYVGKVTGSTVENGNISKWTGASTLTAPSAFVTEDTQSYYDLFKTLDGSLFVAGTATNTYMRQILFQFDVIRALTDMYGVGVWQGKTLLSDKIALAKTYISGWTANFYGYGSSPLGNKVYFAVANANGTYGTTKTHTNATVTELTITSTSTGFIDSNGFISFNAYADPANGVTASTVATDYVELQLTTNPIYVDEWINLGTFYVDSWKSQVRSVILTSYDNLMFLSNIAYNPPAPASRTLYAVAQDIFAQAGITSANYHIDTSLQNVTTNGFQQTSAQNSQTLSCRDALQHVSIAGQCTVYQDRNGVMQITSFGTLDSASLYSNYPTSTTMGTGYASLWGYPVANTVSNATPPTPISSNFINENTAGGMRYIGLSQSYDLPEITLDKSLYQLIVKVYDTSFNATQQTYTNSAVPAGSNGQSFTIDNPLINTTAQAQIVANWFINESNYNAVYKAKWRQNPALQSTDVVVVENGHPDGNGGVVVDTVKQARIYRQEFSYNGYLTGNTDARGGL